MPSSLLILRAVLGALFEQRVALPIGVGELRFAALPLQLVERRLGQEHVAALDERFHEPEQQGQQQRGDVLAVDIGVGHQHDLVIAQFGQIELVVDTGAQRGDDRLDFGVLQHPVDPGLLDVDDLAAQRQDRLEHRVPAALGRAAGRIALHHIEFGCPGVGGAAVGQLSGKSADIGGALAADQFAGLTCGQSGLRR